MLTSGSAVVLCQGVLMLCSHLAKAISFWKRLNKLDQAYNKLGYTEYPGKLSKYFSVKEICTIAEKVLLKRAVGSPCIFPLTWSGTRKG